LLIGLHITQTAISAVMYAAVLITLTDDEVVDVGTKLKHECRIFYNLIANKMGKNGEIPLQDGKIFTGTGKRHDIHL